jgi:hypothetical protein
MKGKIKQYDPHTAAGVIIGNDKSLYTFSEREWWEIIEPTPNQEVDFIDQDNMAMAVVTLKRDSAPKPRC